MLFPALTGRTSHEPNVVSRNTFTFVGVTGVDPVPPDKVNSALVVNTCKKRAGNKCLMTFTLSEAIVKLTAESSFVPGVMFSKSADTEPNMVCGWPVVPAKYKRCS